MSAEAIGETPSDIAMSDWSDWEVGSLADAKGGRRIAVVIPARNESATIGGIVRALRARLVDDVALVDELVVIDSDSTDDTAAIATDAGARVFRAARIRAELGWHPGKGEALWKSLFVTDADLMVFIDADLTEWGPHFVTGLLGPLLADPDVALVKGFYDRLIEDRAGEKSLQGGRVTELVARPLLSLYWPQLRPIVQPLAGEWAIRRDALVGLPIPVGYGVEMSTLLDIYRARGPSAIAQVDLGSRDHRHQSVHDLGVMAAEILAVAMRRANHAVPEDAQLWQFDRDGTMTPRTRQVPLAERPPWVTVR